MIFMADANKTVRYFAKATGHVQGVGFRMYIQQHAMELNVSGWVRNMEDGSVHMELQGPEDRVEQLMDIIEAGNYFIKVETFETEVRPVVDGEIGFKIKY